MNPGWYPDPWMPGLLRWWDGYAWTPHTTPVMAMNAQADLTGERAAARRASIAVLFTPIASVLDVIVIVVSLHGFAHRVREWNDGGAVGSPPQIGLIPVVDVIGLATLAVEILFVIWLYRSATIARRLGIPSRRDPVWAILGFIVPIVSLWFPYQVAAGCFPPGHPDRRLAGYWWAWYLVQGVALAPALIAAIWSVPLALALGVVAVGAAVMSALSARRLIAAATATATHERLISPA